MPLIAHPHLALRAPGDADLARRPAAQGRPHRGGRRGRRRHRDGAGVRARGTTCASASASGPRRCATRVDARGRRRGALPAGAPVPAHAGDRRGDVLRRPRRDRRRPDDRPVRALQHACCCSSPGRSRRSAGSSTWPSARSPRPAARSPGWTRAAAARARAPAHAARRAARRCASRTSTSPTAAEHEVLRERRPRLAAGRDRRRLRRAPAPASRACSISLPRFYDPTAGPRARSAGSTLRDLRARRPAPRGRRSCTQRPVLFSVPLRDNLLAGAARRALGRGAGGVRGRRRRRVRRRAAGRLRHADRRARRQPLGRPAPARRARAGAHLERARARARRPAVGRRHRDRATCSCDLRGPRSPAAPC